jgi:ubiquinone/menaquinone biosynthesis C-methylase UbiE
MKGNLTRFSGFAEDYDTYRPKPPTILKEILLTLVQKPRANLVVDLGSGTGLSTKFWTDVADSVVGIEPNDDMRSRAESMTKELNVSYRKGLSSQTDLDNGTADIVTCSQSLHWMEPQATFAEVARILRRDGVFAAYDCDWPPTTGMWKADQAYEECTKRISPLEKKNDEERRVQKWAKQEHLKRMTESGRFRYTKEFVVHQVEEGNAARFIGILLSQGGIRSLLNAGHTEEELGIDKFRAECNEVLGQKMNRWYWSLRVRIGIR